MTTPHPAVQEQIDRLAAMGYMVHRDDGESKWVVTRRGWDGRYAATNSIGLQRFADDCEARYEFSGRKRRPKEGPR